LKYHPGDFFRIHKDGNYVRENGETSLITMLFYLNEGYKGGKTVFYKPSGNQVNLKVIPKTGMILLHDHMIDHCVPELKKGVKYVIQTDVMYKLET
jgi:prolyl 4-hydroxylase